MPYELTRDVGQAISTPLQRKQARECCPHRSPLLQYSSCPMRGHPLTREAPEESSPGEGHRTTDSAGLNFRRIRRKRTSRWNHSIREQAQVRSSWSARCFSNASAGYNGKYSSQNSRHAHRLASGTPTLESTRVLPARSRPTVAYGILEGQTPQEGHQTANATDNAIISYQIVSLTRPQICPLALCRNPATVRCHR